MVSVQLLPPVRAFAPEGVTPGGTVYTASLPPLVSGAVSSVKVVGHAGVVWLAYHAADAAVAASFDALHALVPLVLVRPPIPTIATAARMPTTTIAISSSIRVNPFSFRTSVYSFIAPASSRR